VFKARDAADETPQIAPVVVGSGES
jgi:hypothetical protein